MGLLAAVCLSVAVNGAELTDGEARAVREAAYGGPLLLFTPERPDGGRGAEMVTVPAGLVTLYQRKPRAVVELLLVVVEGARPSDSVRAAAYALALTDRPTAGALPARHFDEETYDAPDSNRINSRAGWAKAVRAKLAASARQASR